MSTTTLEQWKPISGQLTGFSLTGKCYCCGVNIVGEPHAYLCFECFATGKTHWDFNKATIKCPIHNVDYKPEYKSEVDWCKNKKGDNLTPLMLPDLACLSVECTKCGESFHCHLDEELPWKCATCGKVIVEKLTDW